MRQGETLSWIDTAVDGEGYSNRMDACTGIGVGVGLEDGGVDMKRFRGV